MREMKTLLSLGMALALLGVGMDALAHGPPPMGGEPRKLIETVYVWRMTQELDLSEEQISDFFPKLRRLEDAEREHSEQMAEVIGELDELLKSEQPLPATLKRKMKQLEKIEKGFEKKRAKLKDEISRILSVEQQAKLVVFRHKFHREMRDMIRQIKRRRGAHPGAWN